MFDLLINTLLGSISRWIFMGGLVATLIGTNAIQYYRNKSLKGEYKSIQVQIDECTAQLKIANRAGETAGRYADSQCEVVKNYYEKLLKEYRDRCGNSDTPGVRR